MHDFTHALIALISCLALLAVANTAPAQPFDAPDRDSPGDPGVQLFLAREAELLEDQFVEDLTTREAWEQKRAEYHDEFLYMLGLSPMPEKTPLQATVTGTLEGDGFVVEKLHYQSSPGLYVTGNLYRPANVPAGEKLPAIFYVCGHSGRGRNGNKAAFQSHGIWFARHGYVCLIVDTLQLGEIAGLHHGTYHQKRWWWHSRGYTPAGVECWNGIRGIDYLSGRADVDPERIAVTGISGGGAATLWIAAADPRVKVAVPVSGMSDLPSYVGDRVINGHCDCMFLYNGFRWPWTRIAALIAPRPLLFVNSDADRIFPMDANERIINRLERVYSLYGAGDYVDSLVSIGGHAYREDIRKGVYRFMNTYLKNDPSAVTDAEVDALSEGSDAGEPPIPLESLRVFPTDADLPQDERNTTIDQHFVPMAQVAPPAAGAHAAWKARLLTELRRVTFHDWPERVPAATSSGEVDEETGAVRLATQPGISIWVEPLSKPAPEMPARVVVFVDTRRETAAPPEWIAGQLREGDLLYRLEPRGAGRVRWTAKDPPNYERRTHVLIGATTDSGQVWDIIAATRYLRERRNVPVVILAEGGAAVTAAYAALLEPDIAALTLSQPPLSHMDPAAPALLNVLRVCDVPEVLGMLAPRPLTVLGESNDALAKAQAIYQAAGATATSPGGGVALRAGAAP